MKRRETTNHRHNAGRGGTTLNPWASPLCACPGHLSHACCCAAQLPPQRPIGTQRGWPRPSGVRQELGDLSLLLVRLPPLVWRRLPIARGQPAGHPNIRSRPAHPACGCPLLLNVGGRGVPDQPAKQLAAVVIFAAGQSDCYIRRQPGRACPLHDIYRCNAAQGGRVHGRVGVLRSGARDWAHQGWNSGAGGTGPV